MFLTSIVPNTTEKYTKWKSFGNVDVKNKMTVPSYTIKLYNTGTSEINIFGYRLNQTVNGFYTVEHNIISDVLNPNKTWGFQYEIFLQFDEKNPYVLPPGTIQNPSVVDFAKVSYNGLNLTESELNKVYGAIFKFYTDDDKQDLLFLDTGLTNSEVIFEAKPIGNRWQPRANIIYKKNIHGHLSTPKINNLELWKKYAEKRITETLLGDKLGSSVPTIKRVKIEDFLKQESFLNNKQFDDDKPEPKRVLNRFKDPLPPYDFIWPYGDYYAYNGLRRTYDYTLLSRINEYYTRIDDAIKKYSEFNHPSVTSRDIDLKLVGLDPVNLKTEIRQRREWGFRERVLRGFPYYVPKFIQTATTGVSPGTFSFISPYNNPCGAGPVIAGFVTAGSGIFSGIQPAIEIEYDATEAKRTVRSPTDIPYGNPRVPNGLIFIQDESGAIGFSIGTDMRYMENPFHHDANFVKPSTGDDDMHLGSYGLPKPDYRQFLREGDLVFIQVGVGFKYWHPVLGSQPIEWERLRGIEEANAGGVSQKIQYPEEVVDTGDANPSAFQCSCPDFDIDWTNIGEFEVSTDSIYPEKGQLLVSTIETISGDLKFGDICLTNKTVHIRIPKESKYNNYDLSALFSLGGVEGDELKIVGKFYTFVFEITDWMKLNTTYGHVHYRLSIRFKSASPTKIPYEDCGKEFTIFYRKRNQREKKSCISLREFMDFENAKGKTPPYPCKDMKPGEQKIIRFNSVFGAVSFMFIVDQSGNCLCRKLLSGLAESASDYIWPQPPTQNFPNAKAYIDNWGGYTYPATSQAKEVAVDIPYLPNPFLETLDIPVPGGDDNPYRFDAGDPHEESLVDFIGQKIRLFATGIDTTTSIIEKIITDDPTILANPSLPQVIAIILVVEFGTVALMDNVYQRNRHILPSRIGRDTQFPYTDFYPIQQDHAWSTGTPIPVTSGMEYIMSDVFSVDTRERFSPPPRLITNAQLRGIPTNTWKHDPSDEWKIPYSDQLNFENSVKSKITKQNQYQEFPDSEFISKTPYTENPGSIYKGQLIKLQNVRFVQAPSRSYSVLVPQSAEQKQKFKDEYTSILDELQKYLSSNPLNKIEDFEVSIQGTSFETLNFDSISDAFLEILDILNPIIDLAQTILNVFALIDTKILNYINSFVDVLQVQIKKIEDGAKIIRDLKNTGKLKGFKDEYDIARFIAIKNETDLTGFRMKVNFEQELMNHAFNSDSPFSTIDLNKMMTDFTNFVLNQVSSDEKLDSPVLKQISNSLSKLNAIWDQYYIQERFEIHESFKGPVEPTLLYDIIQKPSTFPWSINLSEGGYWWTHPDIPLTNARSHQNDANIGDPEKSFDNDLSFFFTHGDGNYGVFSNIFTSREVFTQLVSSDKKSLKIPKFFPDDPKSILETSAGHEMDVLSQIHEYTLEHIKSRYVKDLGLEYRASYEPFAEEWKPYRYVDGDVKQKNVFTPIEPGTKFYGDKIYYVVDDDNVVVPIRINANTEIARYNPLVPTGSVDIIGIAWQYSGGTPGMEWERERYMMQVWPRYFSDVGVKWIPPKSPKTPIIDDRERDPDIPITPPDEPRGPRKLPDLTLDIGDAGNPARLNCESVRKILDSQNKFKEELEEMVSWPVDRRSNELDANSDNIHKDPVSGREVLLPSNPQRLKQLLDSMPDYPCKGMGVGEQQTVTITSQQFPGVVRKFFFIVGPNGECLCTMFQPGTEGPIPVDTGNGMSTPTNDGTGTFSDDFTPTGGGGILRRSGGEILG